MIAKRPSSTTQTMNNILVFFFLAFYPLKLTGECSGETREGLGVYTYANGDKYDGEWRGNTKHGKGYFYYNNGELYMGEW